ncbi:hypothetical protein PIB30_045963 [Stylosanthes scabra]|uniref:Ribonuclease H1 N-terminal domain-containing protein n=1 Tax=Stylosanthes scabra TaxID=79078 RepID=A0ABU6RGB8_9FABA|nr:hypothetical protein [Stylosanthes scabra]
MEPALRAFRFFAVTIGKNPGVYDSFEEACSQLVGFPKAEYQGFNSHLLAESAFTARIEAIQDEKECVEEMQALLGDPKMSPPRRRLTFSSPMEELLLSWEGLT